MLAEKKIFPATPAQHSRTMPRESNGTNELLELYLSLSPKQRDLKFADTASAAKITGLTQRTIQLWIEFGVIAAIPIGRKYKIELDSLIAYLKSRIELQA
ncbi:MAG TPA: helix-turn-helix domain-containing protein [Pyrinomonadaceae bacterium]|nr:helix-turn-helix domain-containing protein [Pyrinomonadaceae bacterium]